MKADQNLDLADQDVALLKDQEKGTKIGIFMHSETHFAQLSESRSAGCEAPDQPRAAFTGSARQWQLLTEVVPSLYHDTTTGKPFKQLHLLVC